MQKPFGTSQETRLISALRPEYAKVDERGIREVLAYMAAYAGEIPFGVHDWKNQEERNWGEFLHSDIAVILADISYKNVEKLDEHRQRLVNRIIDIDHQDDWLVRQLYWFIQSDSDQELLIKMCVESLCKEKEEPEFGSIIPRDSKEEKDQKWEDLFPKGKRKKLLSILLQIIWYEDDEEKLRFFRELEGFWQDDLENLYTSLSKILFSSNSDLQPFSDQEKQLLEKATEYDFIYQIEKILRQRKKSLDKLIKLRDFVSNSSLSINKEDILSKIKLDAPRDSIRALKGWLRDQLDDMPQTEAFFMAQVRFILLENIKVNDKVKKLRSLVRDSSFPAAREQILPILDRNESSIEEMEKWFREYQLAPRIKELPGWDIENVFLTEVKNILETGDTAQEKIKKLELLTEDSTLLIAKDQIWSIIRPETPRRYFISIEKLETWLQEYEVKKKREKEIRSSEWPEQEKERLQTELADALKEEQNDSFVRLFVKKLLQEDLGYNNEETFQNELRQELVSETEEGDKIQTVIDTLDRLKELAEEQKETTPPDFLDKSDSAENKEQVLQAILDKIVDTEKGKKRRIELFYLIVLTYQISCCFNLWRERLLANASFKWGQVSAIEEEIIHQIDNFKPDFEELRDIIKNRFSSDFDQMLQQIKKGLSGDAEKLLEVELKSLSDDHNALLNLHGKDLLKSCLPIEELYEKFYGAEEEERKEEVVLEGIVEQEPEVRIRKRDLTDIIRIYRKFYNALIQVRSVVPKHFSQMLMKKNDHSPPIGIVLTFVQLFQHLQDHLNTLTRRHMEYYFEEILQFKSLPAKPDEIFVYFEPGEFFETYLLKKGTGIVGSKNEQSIAPVYKTTEDLELSHIQIAELKTVYVSRNQNVDMGSSFELVSNIFAAPKANTRNGQGEPFTGNQHTWALFGEGQLNKSQNERTMAEAEIGWVISSPILLLHSGKRHIRLQFQFVEESMNNYRILMEDLCTKLPLNFSEVFHKVFNNGLHIQMSGAEGWIDVPLYEVTPPASIIDNSIEINFTLEAFEPAVSPFLPDVVETVFSREAPLIKMTLGGKGYNYIYSFIRDLKIERITIDVDVKDVRTLDLYNNLGQLDSSLPFQPFGPIPIRGAYLAIGYPEIFKKQLTNLELDIEWQNLPQDANGFTDFYAVYEKNWHNESFEVQLSALSNRQFHPQEGAPPIVAKLFENDPEIPGKISSKTKIDNIDIDKLAIKPDYSLEPVIIFDNNTRSGFFKLELSNPPEAFGHELYPSLFTKIVTENATPPVWRLFQKAKFKEPLPLPNEPYTPAIQKMSLAYSATTTLNMALLEAEERDASSPEYVYHIHPFGYQQTYVRGRILNTNLLPQLNEEGYLLIGLSGLQPPQTLSLYFEITHSSKGFTALELPDIYWRYLSEDEWLPFSKDQLLADGTNNFTRSGIVKLNIPYDISRNNTTLPADLHWISVVAKGDIELIGKARILRPHAVKAVWQPDPEDPSHLQQPLPPYNITGLAGDLPAINTVFQPFPSFAGQPAESREDFYVRVSERLKHKGRGVTHSDIEQLVLSAFPLIGQVRCLSNLLYPDEEELSAGSLMVVVAPKTNQFLLVMEPRANVHLLKSIKDYLQQRVSPFVQINVRNPSYEKVKINCDIIFVDMARSGAYIQQLNRNLNEYLAPWLYGKTTELKFGGSISKEAIINFIEQRPYVKFITRFSIIQVIAKEDDYHLVRDTAHQEQPTSIIKAFKPWSVLIPFEEHQIQAIDEDAYQSPQASSIENISVGVDFIIRDEEAEEELYEETMEEETGGQQEKNDKTKDHFVLQGKKFDPKTMLNKWHIDH